MNNGLLIFEIEKSDITEGIQLLPDKESISEITEEDSNEKINCNKNIRKIYSFKFTTFGQKTIKMVMKKKFEYPLTFNIPDPFKKETYYNENMTFIYYFAFNIKLGKRSGMYLLPTHNEPPKVVEKNVYEYKEALLKFLQLQHLSDDLMRNALENLEYCLLLEYKGDFTETKFIENQYNYLIDTLKDSRILLFLLEILRDRKVILESKFLNDVFLPIFFNDENKSIKENLLTYGIISEEDKYAYEYFEDCFNYICIRNLIFYNDPRVKSIDVLGDERKGIFFFDIIDKRETLLQIHRKKEGYKHQQNPNIKDEKKTWIKNIYQKDIEAIEDSLNFNLETIRRLQEEAEKIKKEAQNERIKNLPIQSKLVAMKNKNDIVREKIQKINEETEGINKKAKKLSMNATIADFIGKFEKKDKNKNKNNLSEEKKEGVVNLKNLNNENLKDNKIMIDRDKDKEEVKEVKEVKEIKDINDDKEGKEDKEDKKDKEEKEDKQEKEDKLVKDDNNINIEIDSKESSDNKNKEEESNLKKNEGSEGDISTSENNIK